jgi:hypothetical protein
MLFFKWNVLVFPVCVALLIAGDDAWRDKRVAEWSEEDARHVLDDSPWAKTVTPVSNGTSNGQRRNGGMGRGGGLGGIQIGIPGIGMGRGGMGRGYPTDTGSGAAPVHTLTLRWESALPVREAELKARETNAPAVDEGHYAIAVYGVPSRNVSGGAQGLSNDLKKQAALKREGKKDLKPSSVEILQRDDGPVILYSFPRSIEIIRSDKRVEFQAQIVGLKITQVFILDEMVFQGHLEI